MAVYASKYSVAEEVLLMIKGGAVSQSSNIQIEQIIFAVPTEIAAILKSTYYNEELPSGETIPSGLLLGLYEDIELVYTDISPRSYCILPAIPVSLPRGMGVFEITAKNAPDCVFIPALPGQIAMVKSQRMISNYMKMVVYEQTGFKINFDQNVFKTHGITRVDMRLMLPNIESLDDREPLPIGPEHVAQLKRNLLQLFGGVPQPEKKTDPVTENT